MSAVLTADERLDAVLGSAAAAQPAGRYARVSQAHGLLYSSGVVGRESGRIIAGPLAGPQDIARGEQAAVAAVLQILAAVREELGSLGQVERVVALQGYLCTTADFKEHVRVMDAASACLGQIFVSTPLPARTTVGVASLPGGGAVEVAMVLQLRAGAGKGEQER